MVPAHALEEDAPEEGPVEAAVSEAIRAAGIKAQRYEGVSVDQLVKTLVERDMKIQQMMLSKVEPMQRTVRTRNKTVDRLESTVAS